MPSNPSQVGSDHGPAGFLAVIRKLPPASAKRADEVENTVMLAERGCEDATRNPQAAIVERLPGPIDYVSDLRPVGPASRLWKPVYLGSIQMMN